MSKLSKGPGRPPGAANAKGMVRGQRLEIRCSEGFLKVLDAMVEQKKYKTRADAMHEAVQLLALKKLDDKHSMYWITQI